VVVSQEHMRDGRAQAILASSGCSNVCTGEQGVKDAREMTKSVGELLHIAPRHVLIASTGVIGQHLPMDKIRTALPKLVKGLLSAGRSSRGGRHPHDGHRAQEAALRLEVAGRTGDHWRHRQGRRHDRAAHGDDVLLHGDGRHGRIRCAAIGAEARGGPVVQLGSPSTAIRPPAIPVGRAGERARRERVARTGGKGLRQFARGLELLTTKLARLLVEDGEGATKLVEIRVRGARTRREALLAARSVANSPLVKTAIYGVDPNWGRIMMALGKSLARVVADRVSIAIGDEMLVERGAPRPGARLDQIRDVMARHEYTISVDLGLGRGEDHVWTCDLTEEYVRINSKYTT
jgi:glutamate N-acetyltransferase/amino-acid N-acetyltransferase